MAEGQKSGGLKPNKAQADSMKSMDGQGKQLGWLLEFMRGVAGVNPNGQGLVQTPQQQPMGRLAVPMPQVPMPMSPVIPGVPGQQTQQPMAQPPQAQLQNVMPQPQQQAAGAPQQGAVQQGQSGGTGAESPASGGGGNPLEMIIKIISMIGGK